MIDKNAYLAYLAEKGLREQDVSPIVAKNRREDPEEVAKRIASIPDFFERMELLKAAMDGMAHYDDNTNALMEKMHSELLKELNLLGINVSTGEIFVGVFPTNQFNGHAVPRSGGYLILLDNGLFEILEAATGIMLYPSSPIERAKMLAQVVKDYSIERLIPDPKKYEKYERFERYALGVTIVNFTEQFVIAHEYGHVMLGHFNTNQTTSLSTQLGQISVIEKSPSKEFHADLWALHALFGASERYSENESVKLSWLGAPLIFLGTAILVERLVEAERKRLGIKVSDTHPPASERLIRTILYFGMKECMDWDFGRRYLELVDECSNALFGERLNLNFASIVKTALNIPYKFPTTIESRIRSGLDIGLEIKLLDQFVTEAMEQSKLRPAFYSSKQRRSQIDWGFESWGSTPEEDELLDLFERVCQTFDTGNAA